MSGKPIKDDMAAANGMAMAVLNAIQNPVVLVNETGNIAFANWEAESFFGASATHLARHNISAFIPFGSPLLTLIDQVRERRAPVNEYRVDLSSPRLGAEKLVDLYVAPVTSQPGAVVIVFQERSMADKIDRQLTHRAAARSVTGLASMLAHEIKNPLSGIRGAAQLLESSVIDEDRALTRLICDETDRIVSSSWAAPLIPESGFLISCASMAARPVTERAAPRCVIWRSILSAIERSWNMTTTDPGSSGTGAT